MCLSCIKVIQLCMYIFLLFFRFVSHIGHYRVLKRIPCALQQVLIRYLFYIWKCVYMSIPISQFIPPGALFLFTFPPNDDKLREEF